MRWEVFEEGVGRALGLAQLPYLLMKGWQRNGREKERDVGTNLHSASRYEPTVSSTGTEGRGLRQL